MCGQIGFKNSTIKNIWKNRTKIISVFEKNVFQKQEQSNVNEALPKSFKQQRSDNVPVSGPLLMIIFVLHKFKFKLMYFFLCQPVGKFIITEN